jgi:uncharacterized Tic20 family protein
MESPGSAQDQSGAPPSEQDERVWAMFCHLSALLIFFGGMPFGNIVGPLVVWLAKRNQYPLVNDQGKESLNFQITVAIVMLLFVGGAIGAFIGMFACEGAKEPPIWFFVTYFGAFAALGLVALLDLISVIIAAIQANKGVAYRYPIAIRFVR